MNGSKQSFAVDLNKFADLTNKSVEKVRRGVILKLFGAVVKDTPVDIGRLRGNWLTSIGRPVLRTTKRVDPTGRLVQREIKRMVQKIGPEETAILTNNLPYAERIEYEGWSHTKAPQGMVRRNVIRFQRLIKQEIRRLGR
jgi:hypothetical protein